MGGKTEEKKLGLQMKASFFNLTWLKSCKPLALPDLSAKAPELMKLRLRRHWTTWFLCQLHLPQLIQERHSDTLGTHLGKSKPQTVFHKEEPRKGFHLHIFNLVVLVQYFKENFLFLSRANPYTYPFHPFTNCIWSCCRTDVHHSHDPGVHIFAGKVRSPFAWV